MERLFDIQIEKLKKRLIKMCSLVDEQVGFAIKAIEEEDEELAQLVVDRDKKVDKFDVKIEKICQKIFALNQPVAMDLRLIMSSLTINNNLERIGDIAVNIAESFLIHKKKPAFISKTKFAEMSKVAKEMVKDSIDAFIENDAELARKVIEMDDILDDLNRENHKILIEHMKANTNDIEQAVALLVTSRQMERMGDHSTNIAEDVYFIVEAQLIKHKYEKIILNEQEDDDANDDKISDDESKEETQSD
ncbi:MAG TPA: phosphate signaling complex protein PhoU [Ignavibacteriaceae bacterium]|nr:phosphate signaling complex protein PhoU [Ignavibacteriaceae bacterium]